MGLGTQFYFILFVYPSGELGSSNKSFGVLDKSIHANTVSNECQQTGLRPTYV